MNLRTLIISIFFLLCEYGCTRKEPIHPLRIGSNLWPGYEPLYIAQAKRLFSDNDIRLVEYSSATEVKRAFRVKAIEVAALTLDEAIIVAQDISDLRIIAVMDESAGADAIIGRKGLKNLRDLEGRSIGVEKTALGNYIMNRAFVIKKVDAKKVRNVQMEIDQQERQFLAGNVDAVVTFDPVRSKILKMGGVQLFDSRELPGEILDVLVTRAEWLEKYRQKFKILKQAMYKTLDGVERGNEDDLTIIANRYHISKAEAGEFFVNIKMIRSFEQDDYFNERRNLLWKAIQSLGSHMIERNLIKKIPSRDIIEKL